MWLENLLRYKFLLYFWYFYRSTNTFLCSSPVNFIIFVGTSTGPGPLLPLTVLPAFKLLVLIFLEYVLYVYHHPFFFCCLSFSSNSFMYSFYLSSFPLHSGIIYSFCVVECCFIKVEIIMYCLKIFYFYAFTIPFFFIMFNLIKLWCALFLYIFFEHALITHLTTHLEWHY